jgi:ABC-type transport system substrate-binding protein
MRTWVFPFLTLVFSISLMVSIVLAANGPLVDNLQYKFYTGQNALFTALLNGDIDLMAWPLTYAEYQMAITTTNITVAPYFDTSYYEFAFNNNATDPSHTIDRKAMNYTEFRQAMACLVDKDALISGARVHGFGTRIDTQIARPIMNAWVNFNDSKYDMNGNLINNYPWDFNVTHALEILWTNGWYNQTTYPTLGSLLTAYASGWLPLGSVVYPPGHPRAGTPIDST